MIYRSEIERSEVRAQRAATLIVIFSVFFNAWVLAVAQEPAVIADSGERIQQEEPLVSVLCTPDKCKIVDLFNDAAKLEGEHFDTLARLRESLIHDPAGHVRSLDRELIIKELQGQNSHLAALYRSMLELERK